MEPDMLTVKLKHSPSAALEDHVRKGSSGLRLGFNIRLRERVWSVASHTRFLAIMSASTHCTVLSDDIATIFASFWLI